MFLQKVYKTKNIIFCIDDAQWLDTSSLKVIECLIKKNNKIKHPITISLFLTIDDRDSLEATEEQNYINIYKTISALYKDLEIIYLENFDFDTTSDVIANTSRIFLIEHTSRIYQLTDGNPLELEHTLYFSDSRLRKLLNSKKQKRADNFGDYFSAEYISEIYFKKIIYSVILNILSILNKKMSESFLFKCVMCVYEHIFNSICSYYEFKNAINYLTSYRYVKEDNENNIFLLHDSVGQLILTLISQNGDYVVYSNIISEFLLGSERFDSLSPTTSPRISPALLLFNLSPIGREVKSERCPCLFIASSLILYAFAFSLGKITSLCKFESTITKIASSLVSSTTLAGIDFNPASSKARLRL